MMNQVNTYVIPVIFIPLTLFIIGALIYDHYQYGYFLTSRSSNESFFIEQALKRLPTCNENDYPRQKALLYTLQAWTHIARSHNIRYWIAYKTLASYVQHYNLLPSDDHIDILMMAEDTPELIQLLKTNFSSTYKLKIHPQWFITKIINRSYFPSQGIDFTLQNARFINQKSNVSIYIWPVYASYFNKNSLMLIQYLDVDSWILSPIEWTFPLEPCVISNIRVWCPAQPKRLTTSIYGEKSPDLLCINGSWVDII